jgi:hypothetical protein
MHLSLGASTPHILQQTVPLCQSVQGIIALAHRPNETAQSIDLALACESTVLINLSDGDLNRSVVLGFDDSVGCAAFARNITVEN